MFSVLKDKDTSSLDELFFNKNGEFSPIPSEILREIPHDLLKIFCHKHGIYSVPSVELIERINGLIIDKDKTIEIGSGNGVYGRSLGIRATDSFMQHPKNSRKFPMATALYDLAGQPLVTYGDNVEEMDGQEAVRRYKAETVVCAWVTHKYRSNAHHRQGNMYGVDFEWILKRKHVKRLILVGNTSIHSLNKIMELPHTELTLPNILFSRSSQPELDRVFIWDC